MFHDCMLFTKINGTSTKGLVLSVDSFYFGDPTNGKADFDQYVILCMRNEISKRRKDFLHNRSVTPIHGLSIEIGKKSSSAGIDITQGCVQIAHSNKT